MCTYVFFKHLHQFNECIYLYNVGTTLRKIQKKYRICFVGTSYKTIKNIILFIICLHNDGFVLLLFQEHTHRYKANIV